MRYRVDICMSYSNQGIYKMAESSTTWADRLMQMRNVLRIGSRGWRRQVYSRVCRLELSTPTGPQKIRVTVVLCASSAGEAEVASEAYLPSILDQHGFSLESAQGPHWLKLRPIPPRLSGDESETVRQLFARLYFDDREVVSSLEFVPISSDPVVPHSVAAS